MSLHRFLYGKSLSLCVLQDGTSDSHEYSQGILQRSGSPHGYLLDSSRGAKVSRLINCSGAGAALLEVTPHKSDVHRKFHTMVTDGTVEWPCRRALRNHSMSLPFHRSGNRPGLQLMFLGRHCLWVEWCPPQICMLKSYPSEPQNVSFFGNGVMAGIIS